jgi:flagellar hook assembly protein FlgD
MAVSGVNSILTIIFPRLPERNRGADKASASLNYDNFLKLLMAQMKNQDPTDPMDASQQIAQLATFSQVEQTIKTNTNLESLLQRTSLSRSQCRDRQDGDQRRRQDNWCRQGSKAISRWNHRGASIAPARNLS